MGSNDPFQDDLGQPWLGLDEKVLCEKEFVGSNREISVIGRDSDKKCGVANHKLLKLLGDKRNRESSEGATWGGDCFVPCGY